MTGYIARRLVKAVGTIAVVAFVMFVLMELLPGSPFNSEKLEPYQKELLAVKYGLDEPFLVRLVLYFVNLLKGDLGVSYNIIPDLPVSTMISSRLPVTIRIGLQALAIGVVLGLIWGIIAALKKRTWVDTGSTFISVVAFSVPSYVFALLLVYVAGFELNWFPILYSASSPYYSSVLPTIALAAFVMAVTARYSRSEMIDTLDSDYIMLARAKGLSERKVVTGHALRNTMVSMVTVISPLLIGLITGSVVVEQVFAAPGLGQLLLAGIQNNDYNVVMGIALVYSVIYIVVMLIVDVSYGLIDPRIRLAGHRR